MPQAENIIEGLIIINNARPEPHKKGSSYHVRAEHDEIIAGSLDWKLSKKDKEKLSELGWVEEPDYDGWRCMV